MNKIETNGDFVERHFARRILSTIPSYLTPADPEEIFRLLVILVGAIGSGNLPP